MKILILEAMQALHLNAEAIDSYTRVAREHGNAELWILTREGVRAGLPDELPPSIRMLEEVPDFYARGGLERRAMELLEQEDFDLLFAPREGDIIRAARLREAYDVPGQDTVSALAYRDKLQMKAVLAAKGVAAWSARGVDDAVDYWSELSRTGMPAVLKPRYDRGAENIDFIKDDATALEAAQRCFARLPIDAPAHYVLEPFTGYQMCHVDGIWHQGRPYYMLTSEYYGFGTGRPLDESLSSVFGSRMIDPDSERGSVLRGFVRDVIEALPSPETFSFHAEVWVSPKGELYVNEIASRTGGFAVLSNAVASTGAHPDGVWLALLTGVDPARIGYRGASGFWPCAGVNLPYRSGRIRSVDSSCTLPSVVDLKLRPDVVPGTVLPTQAHWTDALGEATVTADSYTALPEEIDRLVDWASRAIVLEQPSGRQAVAG
ncbi:hypothetical protein DSC45_34400 [Streptomyces sp. YIM 130001]|uniref:ATP-grasp domain-containing protein n=1 Tax=Streptomyces sp. YIM 130001 TaxID=2259644 RepID=UPI000E64B0A6|nr:hypothetical protein [Streptomyces sp. YIM 130001]RII07919.1 hypothetical protein DSC45_34400 [Streptomyces sp. YIM 130001]